MQHTATLQYIVKNLAKLAIMGETRDCQLYKKKLSNTRILVAATGKKKDNIWVLPHCNTIVDIPQKNKTLFSGRPIF